MKLNIAHLYPELLNLYGDFGNIVTLKKRALWRNIEVCVKEYNLNDTIDFSNTDILFLGGGSEKDQLKVCNKMYEFKDQVKNYVENNGVLIAICGGYEILGKYYVSEGKKIKGLSVIDMTTEEGDKRFISNIIIKSPICTRPVVGFENHIGRTNIYNNNCLGRVMYGNGNNGNDKKEGVIYKNLIGTYMHGPLLPKNPELCDYIIKKALEKKYGDIKLDKLDDTVEIKANEYICNRFLNK